MLGVFKAISLGLLLGFVAFAFSACQDSKKNSATALDGQSAKAAGTAAKTPAQIQAEKMACESLKAMKATNKDSKEKPTPEKLKMISELEAQLNKGAVDARFIVYNQKLLEQADQVFAEVWKKLEAKMTPVPLSVFAATRKNLALIYSAETGLPLPATPENSARALLTAKGKIETVLVRDQDCRPSSLEIQLVDATGKKIENYATLKYTTSGYFEWSFNSAVMPEAVGQRLATNGKSVTCNVRYAKNLQLRGLSCLRLGQEGIDADQGGAKIQVEYDNFYLNLDDPQDIFTASTTRYLDLVNKDAKANKQIKIPAGEMTTMIKVIMAPDTDPGKDLLLDPRLEAAPAPAAAPAAGTPPAAGNPEKKDSVAPTDSPAPAQGSQAEEAAPLNEQERSATSQGDSRDEVAAPAKAASPAGASGAASPAEADPTIQEK